MTARFALLMLGLFPWNTATAHADADNDASTSDVVTERAPLAHPPQMKRGRRIAGVTLAAIGVADLVTAVTLTGVRHRAGNRFVDEPDNRGRENRWRNLGKVVFATASVGGAARIAAIPLLMKKREKMPVLGWISLASSIGAVGFAAVQAALLKDTLPGPCSTSSDHARACVRRAGGVDRVFVSSIASAVLFTVPLTHWLQPKNKTYLTPEINGNRTGGQLTLRGRF